MAHAKIEGTNKNSLSSRQEISSGPSNLRIMIENVKPMIDDGHFPIKRTIGEAVRVTADIFVDGNDTIKARIRYRHKNDPSWKEIPMNELPNDCWDASFPTDHLGVYEYTLEAWIDSFTTWRKELEKKIKAGQEIENELLEGSKLILQSAKQTEGPDTQWLREQSATLSGKSLSKMKVETALNPELLSVMNRYPDRQRSATYDKNLEVVVETERSRYGAWYEMFPRSCGKNHNRTATFKDAEERLSYIAKMGFDVLYLPPIHPIGKSFRKGPNNSLRAGPKDPGSPWAIGSAEGGHKSIHPDLGTIQDFDRFLNSAKKLGIEIALDIAYQCSPDHPYVKEHPEWFRHRPDGSIKYAENPPKKYQDIYPLNFECEKWRTLWEELKEVVLFWIDHGVKIFRVDNPHTKSLRFWEWLIKEVKNKFPDTVFLAEAFTRPKVMRSLAKCGFSQSYTYFTWRNTQAELTQYLTELTQTDVREYMRPNFFANTPDILHEYLQFGGRPGFQIRLVLAATLSATYGIYGPPFELCDGRAVPNTEEYQDSEKYQIRSYDLDQEGNLKEFIALINSIRRENPALQHNWNLRFFPVDNNQLIFYGKTSSNLSNIILVIVNLDPHHAQSGWVKVPVGELGLDPSLPYQVHDLISGARYLWHGESNFVMLDPQICPTHILRVRRKIKTEKDFDYFL